MSDRPSASGSLPAGTRLAHYELQALVGEGGMGQVYRARDTKLQRDVALKLLPSEVATDPERRQRFEREARAVAALNHPGIVTIHSVDDVDGRMFLTMELVNGRPLADLIPRGGMALDRLLTLAVPLADAVGAAHARGITHRDLKPANVMVTADGRLKVLDFGLARLLDAPRTADPDFTEAPELITGQGRILGTIAYMSPEQAEGKAVDARSDVFSLGVLLYEMAAGERPFTGDTSMSTLAAIMRDAPKAVTEVNPAVPRELWRVIRRALSKDPDRRQQTAKDLRNDLDELRREIESGELAAPAPSGVGAPNTTDALAPAVRPPSSIAPPSSSPSAAASVAAPSPPRVVPRSVIVVGLLVVVAAAVAGALWRTRPSPAAVVEAPASAGIAVESVVSLTSEDGVEEFPSLSPDGRWLIYSAREPGRQDADILLRAVGGQTAINLTTDSTVADVHPAFSPDGERIAFRSSRAGGGIFVMGRTGESVRRLTSAGFSPTWSPDGQNIAYTTEGLGAPTGRTATSQLWMVNVSTGERRQLPAPDAMQAAWSPHAHRIAYWGLSGELVQRDLWTISPSGGDPVRLTNDAAVDWSPVWSPDGRFIYYSSDRAGQFNLWRIAVDEATGAPRGQPQPVTLPRQGIAHLSFAADGLTLAATSRTVQSNIELLSFDPAKGVVTGRQRVTNVSEVTQTPSMSRDGQWIAFYRTSDGQEDIWVVKRDGSGLRRLTNDRPRDRQPVWTPDGQRLVFYSDRSGRFQIWSMGVDGSDLRQVTDLPEITIQARLTLDGGRAFANLPFAFQSIVFDPTVQFRAEQVERLAEFPGGLVFTGTSWSPDGRLIAGYVNRAGSNVFVYDMTRREYLELAASGQPVWMPDGRRIVSANGNTLNLLDTQTRAVTPAFTINRETIGGSVDVSADGREIVAVISNVQADIILAKLAPPR